MVKVKENENTPKGVDSVDSALTRTEKYIEQNQKMLTTAVLVILAIVAAYMGFRKFILAPKEAEAQKEIFAAESYFAQDSFRLALEGDGNNLGFLEVSDNYRITRTAKLAKYYSGLCYLHMGEFDDAIKYLKKYNTKSKIVGALVLGAIGEAYEGKEEYPEAAQYYVKASEKNPNLFTSPMFLMKAAQVYEAQNNYKEALSLYERIQDKFPQSNEAATIDKYIARAKAKITQ